MKHMTTFFGVLFIMLMVFATGAIEADQYLIGLGFAVLGIVSGILTIALQETEKKETQLYYKED